MSSNSSKQNTGSLPRTRHYINHHVVKFSFGNDGVAVISQCHSRRVSRPSSVEFNDLRNNTAYRDEYTEDRLIANGATRDEPAESNDSACLDVADNST